MGEKLVTHKDQAFMSRELATIHRDVPIDLPDLEAFRLQEPDTDGLRAFYARLELRQLLDRLDADQGPEKPPEGKTFSDLAEMERLIKGLAPGTGLSFSAWMLGRKS